ncbi:MAG TPA: DNA internalization-related competence protein ComEC/Rec2 [Thermoanaerobaculia bacterium]|nr:DNA internalization-related competence protein ComEC/Rec2 [Thermoanaerobaculia bacterium]
MLLPAAAFAAGTLLAFQVSYLSISLLVALALAGLALGRRAGICLAFLSFGLLAAAVRLGLPGDPAASPRRDRPVEAVLQVAGHWTSDDEGWSAPARVVRLIQGDRLTAPPIEIIVHLPDPEELPPPFGATLRAKGYLARSPALSNRIPAPPGPWRLRIKSRQLMEIESPPGPVARLSGAIRLRVEEAYRAAGPGKGEGKALARALVLGDTSALPLAWKRGLRVTGIYHLMSVSGVHVALVAGLVWLLAGWLPRPLRLLLMLAAILLYLLLVGPLPSLVRSAVMGALAALALLAERPPAAANALGWAVILLLLDQPDLALSPAFQLTVSATAGLLLLAPPLARRWQGRWFPMRAAEPVAASVGAQLATLPWALPRFHMLSPLAPLLNLPAVPWTGLVLIASLLWTAVALLSPGLAGHLLPVLDFLAAPFSWPSRTPPEVWLPVPLALSAGWAWAVAAGIAALLLLPLRRRTVLFVLAVLAVLVVLAKPGHPDPELAMLDVGQGDAILLRDGGRAILVDGGGSRGGDIGGRALLPALLGEGVKHLDALVMTHPDNDHCGGLVDISAYLPVREVWMAPGWDRAGCAGRLLDLPGTRTRFLSRGQRLTLGRWRLAVLHPTADSGQPVNERSLVLLAESHGRRALLTGDVEKGGERDLVDCCARDLRADLLKVAHHGSRTSSTEDFLEAVAPRLALISVGVNNLYHHPAPEIVERLGDHHARMLRTDRAGEIVVRFGADGRLRIEMPGAPK